MGRPLEEPFGEVRNVRLEGLSGVVAPCIPACEEPSLVLVPNMFSATGLAELESNLGKMSQRIRVLVAASLKRRYDQRWWLHPHRGEEANLFRGLLR